MDIIAAYLLNQVNGREATKEKIEKLLKIVGSSTSAESIALFLDKKGSMTHDEIMQAGAAKMESCAAAGAATGEAVAKEEVKEESEESEVLDMF